MNGQTTGWEHFDHGADIGVRGIGATPEQAFEQAAIAMTAVVCDPQTVRAQTSVDIECQGSDLELLFVDWLNALIYEMSTRRMLFRSFKVRIDSDGLAATATGETVDQDRHQPAVEIKGATFTTLQVEQDSSGRWCAQTVVDV